jgi:hypothetical protein
LLKGYKAINIKSFAQNSLSQIEKLARPRNYDDMIEAASAQELQLVREEGAVSDSIESQSQKKPVKYKTTIKRRTKNSR